MIKTIKVSELSSIIEIEKNSFNDYWSIESYETLLKDYDYKIFIYEEDKRIKAFAIFLDMVDVYELIKIAVDASYRKQGIAYSFLTEIQNSLEKNIFLEVRENNLAAINLYEKSGYKRINIRKNYYRDTGENAIIMSYEK